MMLSQVWLSFLERRDPMSEKRRDKRNRILREGEYQRADGRYRYRYIDEDGKEKWVYSWRLDKNDPTPRGKKWELSLREKEKQIQADLFDHIVTHGGDYSVIELVEKYISLKTGVNHNTRAGYKTVINILKKDPFGKQRIDKVRLSDAKAWLIKLQQVDGKGYSSIHSIRGVLRPAFQMAVDDDLLTFPLSSRILYPTTHLTAPPGFLIDTPEFILVLPLPFSLPERFFLQFIKSLEPHYP